MLDVWATTFTDALLQSDGSATMVPVHSSNWPRTLLTMWRIVKLSSEWATSIFHVGSALASAAAADEWGVAEPCAAARPGSSAERIASLRIICGWWGYSYYFGIGMSFQRA